MLFPERSKLAVGPLTLLHARAELGGRPPTCAKTVTLLLNSCWHVELHQETSLAASVLPSALSLTLAEELWQIEYKWKWKMYLFLEPEEMQSI